MTTLAEIERAAEQLPGAERAELFYFLVQRIFEAGQPLPEPREFSAVDGRRSGGHGSLSRRVVKVFLDASVVLAACGRPNGASRAVFDLAPESGWQLLKNLSK